MVYADKEGTVLLASNMENCDEVISIPHVTIAEACSRMLIGNSVLDDMGYYTDHGGGGARVRYGPHGRTILALPRVSEDDSGQQLDRPDVTNVPESGPIDFKVPGSKRNRLYPIPDALILRGSKAVAALKKARTQQKRRQTQEINYIKHHSSLDDRTTRHILYGHTNHRRLDLM